MTTWTPTPDLRARFDVVTMGERVIALGDRELNTVMVRLKSTRERLLRWDRARPYLFGDEPCLAFEMCDMAAVAQVLDAEHECERGER